MNRVNHSLASVLLGTLFAFVASGAGDDGAGDPKTGSGSAATGGTSAKPTGGSAPVVTRDSGGVGGAAPSATAGKVGASGTPAVAANPSAGGEAGLGGGGGTEPTTAYGVRWKLVVDEVDDYLAPCERVGLSGGLTATDFDKIYPFRDIKRCNVLDLENGATRITYEGESGFSLTGSNGNVFVEIPKHYIRRSQSGGYEYRYVSDRPLDGFAVDPAFVEDGKELDRIYVSAYEAYIHNGKMSSITGVYPTANCTRPQYRSYARANGPCYGILDIRTLNMLQDLYLVEYADRDSQAAVGQGWGKIHQPAKGTLRCTLAEKGANRISVSDWSAALGQRLFVGSAIEMVDYDTHAVLLTGRTIVRVSLNTPSTGYTAIYFDGDPIDTTTNMVLGGAAQKTGRSDTLPTPSGHTEDNGGGADAAYRNAVRYRYMENLWGNVWHFIDGVNLSNGVSYVCSNMRNYESGVTTGAYRPVAVTQAIQTNNGTVGGDQEIHYMKNLVFDPLQPFLALPRDYVNQGETSVPHAQTSPRLGSDTLRRGNFGDYYYLDTKATCYVHGGGFDHYWRCGLFTMRGWATDTTKWYLYGARLIYKPM